jgi:Mce-associated membrane protein
MTDETPDLKPDERLCPMCAEPVKRAAVRCRWCHADIEPLDAPVPAPVESAEPDPVSPAAVVPEHHDERSGRSWGTLAAAALLAVGCVLAAVVLVRLLTHDEPGGRPQGNTPAAEGAVIADDDVKRAALSAAAEATQKVLSYSHDTLDQDIESARSVIAGEMLQQYDDTMSTIRSQTEKNEAVVQATVVASSAISVTDTDAKVLLFVNQETDGKHLETRRVDLNRVVVRMERDGGDWHITQLDAL